MTNNRWWVLAAVACGTFMATLDSSIVNIALPTLTKEIGVDLVRTKWVVVVYLLVITCLLLPLGRLSDEYGRKRVFQIGFLVFTSGSALCGLAPSLGWLVFARALQGIGAAMLMANGPAIITAGFPATERGAALGTMAMVVSAGLVTGPSIGGFLIASLGWRSLFIVNVPVGLLGAFLVHRFVEKESFGRTGGRFDWAGALIQTFLLLSFMAIFDPPKISISGSDPFAIPRFLPALLTIGLAAIFVKVELDAEAPLFDMSLLRNRTFWTANLASFLTFVAYTTVSVLMPFFLEEILKFSPDRAGLFMTAIPLMILVVAPISGRLSDRLGSHGLSFTGALIGSITLFGMAGAFGGGGMNADTDEIVVALALCLIGISIGLFQAPNNNAIMGSVPPQKLGVASALLATVRNLGLVTGTGLATGIFAWRHRVTGDFVSALHLTHLVAGVVGIGAVVAALGKERGPVAAASGKAEAR